MLEPVWVINISHCSEGSCYNTYTLIVTFMGSVQQKQISGEDRLVFVEGRDWARTELQMDMKGLLSATWHQHHNMFPSVQGSFYFETVLIRGSSCPWTQDLIETSLRVRVYLVVIWMRIPPQAHAVECVVPRWWNCLERIRKWGHIRGGVSLRSGLCDFKSRLYSS